MRHLTWAFLLAGCTGTLFAETVDAGEPGEPGRDAGTVTLLDGSPPPGFDAGFVPPGEDAGAPPTPPAAGRRAEIPTGGGRPVDLMDPGALREVAERAPTVGDPWLLEVLEHTDTMFYDQRAIVPGYQDSFGDNVVTPIGMRPNSIDPGLINLAVPGGHEQIFVEFGVFHFPFGRPAGSVEEDLAVVNFWRPPRDDAGQLLPVLWWQRDPNSLTHRVEWMFPVGTVLGEVLYVRDGGARWAFEIRTRVRELDGWRSDVFRPFPTAAELASAIEAARPERAEWLMSAEIDALVAHLRDPSTLRPARLSPTNFPGAFAAVDGAEDVLPALSDDSILRELLLRTPFRSARGEVWKEHGGLVTYAPTTDAAFSVVPRGYVGGFLEVSDASCDRCHQDAGRPFRDWYPNILAYGELWGEDESFTWHPFANDRFVDGTGRVVQFNHDNRAMRQDFVTAGVLVPYERAAHAAPVYQKLPGEWKDYAY